MQMEFKLKQGTKSVVVEAEQASITGFWQMRLLVEGEGPKTSQIYSMNQDERKALAKFLLSIPDND